MSIVEIQNVSITYHRKSTPTVANVDASFEAGTITALVGPNGAGKSTLLKSVADVVDFDGEVMIDGAPLRIYSRREKVKQVAFVAQHGNANSELLVRQVVELSRMASKGPFARQTDEDHDAISHAVEHADVAHLMDRTWNTLSGGEQQRVQLARAISQSAKVLVLDEPTNHLDIHHQFRLMEQLRHLAADHNVCVIVAMHDLGLASRYCDQIVLLEDGVLVKSGTPHEVFTPERLMSVFGIDAEITTVGGHLDLAVNSAVPNWKHHHEPKEDLAH